MTDYCDVADVTGMMPDTDFGNTYHALMAALITRASRLIDKATGREDGAYEAATATIRYFDGSGGREMWVNEMAAAPTAVAVDEVGDFTYTAWASSDYLLWPYNAAAMGRPYQRLDIDQLNGDKVLWYRFPKSVKITAKWGYSTTVPEDIKQAVVIQVIRWFKRSQQSYQDAGAIVDLGQLRYVKQLDPDVQLIISHYMRTAV
jgi:hypothetical protein